jgi:hypothetical protein
MTRARKIARWLLPVLVSLGVCAILLWPFRTAEGRAELTAAVLRASPWTIPSLVLYGIANWVADAWATGMTFRRFGTSLSVKDACLIRGVTLLFDAVNPSLGQLAIGLVLYRRGSPLARTVQVMLLINVIFVFQLIAAASAGLLLGHDQVSAISTRLTVISLCIAGAYVTVIAIKPRRLARMRSLAQLFEVGVSGHAYAFAVRVPSMVALFGGMILTMRCFGMAVPLSAALVYIPAVILLVGLPISVQGIGPAQVAQIALFARYIPGDPKSAEALVLAWGLTLSVGTAMMFFLIGVGCLLSPTGRETLTAGRAARLDEVAATQLG